MVMCPGHRVLRALGILLVLLLGSMVNVALPKANPETIVGVWYPDGSSEYVDLPVGTTFRLTINVTNAPAFVGYRMVFRYNTIYLDALSATTEGTWACPTGNSMCETETVDISDPLGTVDVDRSYVDAHGPGNGTMIFIDLKVTGVGRSILVVEVLGFVDTNFGTISTTVRDGHFNNSVSTPPIAYFTFRSLDLTHEIQGRIVQGDIVEFNASASYDPDGGNITKYRWNFQDGSADAQVETIDPVVTHLFRSRFREGGGETPLSGYFTVVLIVFDDDIVNGERQSSTPASHVVFVEPGPPFSCPSASIVRVPEDCRTIREALESVVLGGTVEVGAGTYAETVAITKSVILLGAGSDVTTITTVRGIGTASGPALTVRAQDVHISGFSVIALSGLGTIIVEGSSRITLSHNLIGGPVSQYFPQAPNGIHITNSSNIGLEHNLIENRTMGIIIQGSPHNTLRYNTIQGSSRGLDVSGDRIDDFLQDIDQSNTVDGRPFYYIVGARSAEIPEEVGYLGLVNSHNLTIGPHSIEGAGQGILLAGVSNITIANITITKARQGIFLFNSTLTVIRDTVIVGANVGLLLQGSHMNSFVHNRILLAAGIDLRSSSSNRFEGNLIDRTIQITNSPRNLFRNNEIRNSSSGIVVSSMPDLGGRKTHVRQTADYIQDIDTSNIVDGRPIYYLVNQRRVTVPPTAGYLAIINSTNVEAHGLNFSSIGPLLVIASTNVLLDNLNMDPVIQGGIYAWSSTLVEVRNSHISHTIFPEGNTIVGNLLGFEGSGANILYQNNFMENTIQAEGQGNIWNNGAGEGNYWSDYKGQDLNGDGIGDTQLPHLGFDSYPLMAPWMPDGLTAKFVGRAVWPEQRRFDISTDEDHFQTLFAKARNTGGAPVWVQATFTLTTPDGTSIELVSEPVWIGAAEVAGLSVFFQPTPGVYKVSVELRFSSDAYLNWTSAGLRTFFFFVVP